MSLWAVFVLNLRQVVKEWQTRDRLFPHRWWNSSVDLKKRLHG